MSGIWHAKRVFKSENKWLNSPVIFLGKQS